MKHVTLLFPKVFEFMVTDGDILNFWRLKAMNIGF